jgi:ADP-heptose:LPS heptosyltransferase
LIKPRHVLVFRFSSLGDVAMTVPVIKLLLQQHPDLEVTMVSAQFVQPLFEGLERFHFHGADLKNRHKGLAGLYRLYSDLKKLYTFEAIVDLHNSLRTKLIRSFFTFSKKSTAVIDKGRKEKKQATRQQNKILRPLKSTFERYADVFALLGLPVLLNREGGIMKTIITEDILKREGYSLIGVAPFAYYTEKMYPIEKMKEVLRLLLQHSTFKIFLFGGKDEAPLLQQWETEFPGIKSMAAKMSFQKQLHAIAQLDLMVSMDSANMHFASLYGVPVISVWGGTHPWLGFYGWGQPETNAVQIDLECRPSSVFGNKPCPRGDLACMNLISPIMIYEKIMKKLNK